MEKNEKLCGNFQQYYAEESDDYAEKTPDYAAISKFLKLFPWLFRMYIILVNVLPRIKLLHGMFDLLLPFVDSYFFNPHSFSIVFVRSLVTRHLIGRGTLDTESLQTRTQAHHQKMHGTPGGLKLFANEKACFGRCFG